MGVPGPSGDSKKTIDRETEGNERRRSSHPRQNRSICGKLRPIERKFCRLIELLADRLFQLASPLAKIAASSAKIGTPR